MQQRSVLLVLGAMFAFGLMALFTREANAPILTIAAWRAVLVALVFAVWTVAAEGGVQALRPDRQTLKLGIPYGIALAIASSTFVGGYALTTVANTIFLHNLAPAIVFPLAWWWFKERPSTSNIAGAAIALLGVGLLSGVSIFHFANFTDPRFLLGDMLSIISALGYAAVLLITRATRQADTPLIGTLFVAWTVAAIGLSVLTVIFGTMRISPMALLWVLGLAIVCTNIPFTLLNMGMKKVNTGTAALLSMTEVLFATFLGVIVYSEDLAPIGWIGGIMVVMGVLYPFLDPQTQDTSDALPMTNGPTRTRRWMRLFNWLFLLNAGALMAVLGGQAAGALLAWIAIVAILRLTPPVLTHLLDGNFSAAIRWISTGAAALTGLGLLTRGGWNEPAHGWGIAAIAVAVIGLDHVLGTQEAEDDADPARVLHVALAAVAIGSVAGLAQHPATHWLPPLAAVFAGLAAWGVFSAAIRGGPWWQSSQHVDRLCTPVFSQPIRVGAFLFLLFVAGGVQIVPPGHRGLIERFGEPLAEAAHPGLLVRFPPPIEHSILVDVDRTRRLDLLEDGPPMLCSDQSLVAVDAVLHYKISDPHRYAYTAIAPDRTLQESARSILTATVTGQTQDAILTEERREIEAAILAATKPLAEQLGLSIEGVHLTTVAVPAPVMDSFLDVISADEERSTLINQAEAYAATVLPQALGTAAALHQEATGDAARYAAETDAWLLRFEALSVGGSPSPSLTRHRIQSDAMVNQLSQSRLIIAPADVQVWIGGSTLPPEGTLP